MPELKGTSISGRVELLKEEQQEFECRSFSQVLSSDVDGDEDVNITNGKDCDLNSSAFELINLKIVYRERG